MRWARYFSGDEFLCFFLDPPHPPPPPSFVGVNKGMLCYLVRLVGWWNQWLIWVEWWLWCRHRGWNARGIICLARRWRRCSCRWWSGVPRGRFAKHLDSPFLKNWRRCHHIGSHGLKHILDILVLHNLLHFILHIVFECRRRGSTIWTGSRSYPQTWILRRGMVVWHGMFVPLKIN